MFARWVLVMTTSSGSSTPIPTPTSTRSGGTSWSGTSRSDRPDDRHEPDWASKIHLAAAPVYYQNYLYGELFASQLDATLTDRAGGLVDRRAAGELLVRDVFGTGRVAPLGRARDPRDRRAAERVAPGARARGLTMDG